LKKVRVRGYLAAEHARPMRLLSVRWRTQPAALLATQCKARDITLMPGSQDFAADPRNADVLVNLNGRLVARDAATQPHYQALKVHCR
jgi:hypothetical protein